MSRIGRMPITVPPGVVVNIKENEVSVKGPKGELKRVISPDMKLTLEGGKLLVARPSDDKDAPRPARPDAQPAGQHGRRRHQGLREKPRNCGRGFPR